MLYSLAASNGKVRDGRYRRSTKHHDRWKDSDWPWAASENCFTRCRWQSRYRLRSQSCARQWNWKHESRGSRPEHYGSTSSGQYIERSSPTSFTQTIRTDRLDQSQTYFFETAKSDLTSQPPLKVALGRVEWPGSSAGGAYHNSVVVFSRKKQPFFHFWSAQLLGASLVGPPASIRILV
eukprot:COSAG06_NODE_982_length_11218_cov_22.274845_3_plen_179_part_00